MPQCLSGNAEVRHMPSGGSIPAGLFAPAAGASALGENPTFFDSGGVVRLFWRLRAKFLRVSLIERKTHFSG